MLTEPATMLTDYAVAVLCAYVSWRLSKTEQAKTHRSVGFWAAGMGSLALASGAGGTVHGWALILTQPVLWLLWQGALILIGLAGSCFLAGTFAASIALPYRRLLMTVPIAQLVAYTVWMATHSDFRYAVYNYGGTFALILLVQLYELFIRKAPSAAWIVAGVLVSVLAAMVQLSGLTLHPSFNHNDLYHVIQMAGIVLLYRGAALLHDRR